MNTKYESGKDKFLRNFASPFPADPFLFKKGDFFAVLVLCDRPLLGPDVIDVFDSPRMMSTRSATYSV